MKTVKKAALLLSVLFLLCAFAPFIPADFGDYGGDSDYGGGYDSYDSYDSYDYDDDDDGYAWGGGSGSGGGKTYYYHYAGYPTDNIYYGGNLLADRFGRSISAGTLSDRPLQSDEEDGGSGAVLVFLLFGLAAVIAVIVLRVKSGSDRPTFGGRGGSGSGKRGPGGSGVTRSMAPGAQPTPPSELKNISAYYKLDPDFSEAAFTEKLSNLYVRFQNAWQDKDLETLRPYLTDAFYAQMDRQLDAYRRNKQTNRVERIAVLGVSLCGWQQRGGDDVMVARLRTRIVDYVTDDVTGKVVRGSKTAEKFMEYEWTLTRKTGIRTGVNDGVRVQNCPNCGGTVNINRTARCPYCDSIITVDAHDWAVSGIKGLSQRTSGR